MKKVWLWLMGSVVVLGLGAGLAFALRRPPVGAPAAETVTAEVVARGLEVYASQYCGVCHSLRAAGAKGAFGPPHDAMGVIAGARFQDPNYRGEATSAEVYLRESIVSPKAYLVPGYGLTHHHMPAYTSLSEADLDALVKMLLAQTGGSTVSSASQGGE